MARTGDAAAINARRVSVVTYDPDPRGWSMFRRLSGALHRGHDGTAGNRVLDPVNTFTGALVTTPHSLSGMAPLGTTRAVVPTSSTLGDHRSAGILEDGALRIFAERLRRGK